MLADLRARLTSLLHRTRIETELDEELRAHIQSRADDLERSGLGRADAVRRARIEFGGVERFKEECRDALGTRFLESLVQDIRFGLRTLRNSPGFTAVAIVTLALGIGANTAIFSAVNGILIEPLPYPDSARLVQIGAKNLQIDEVDLSLPEISDIQAHCPSLGEMAYYGAYGGENILGGEFPDRVFAALVSGSFFTMLGGRPLLGRPILPGDMAAGNEYVAVLSYGLWKADFGGDPKVIGKTITLGKRPFTVIGVMPPGFLLDLFGRSRGVWIPLVPSEYFGASRGVHRYFAMAQLRPGASIAEANVQLKTLSARLSVAYPATDKGWQLSAESEKHIQVGSAVTTELLILMAAVAVVLLIACVNVSSMLLARSWTRHREVAIREALGATRRRVVWQFLVESLLLALAGGALGLLLAVWMVPALRAIAPTGTPRINNLRLDTGVFWFTLGVSVLSGILFGLVPALQTSVHGVGATLKEGVGGLFEGFSGRGPRRLRGALVIFEIALAMVLAAGATLVARSLQKMLAVRVGFPTDRVLTVGVTLLGSACDFQHPAPCFPITEEILDRLKALPGVEAATAAGTTPAFAGYGTSSVDVESGGRAELARANGPIMFDWVLPGYFSVVGIPLMAGRDFTPSDTAGSRRVAIVNEAFVRRFLPGANPLGRRISVRKDKNGNPEWMEMVGEAANVHSFGIAAPPPLEFYMPWTQAGGISGAPTFLLRTAGNPVALATAVKRRIASVDKYAPIGKVETLNEIIATSEAAPRFRTALLGAFGLLGVLLAIVGIYGVISYAVSRRTREIGLRMALGAQPGDALRMVIREGMVLAAVGIVIGIGGALALTRFLRSFLFEIKPIDPATFAGVAIALALAALVACYIPARRAMRVDPMAALRHE